MKRITLLCLFALFGVALFARPVKSMLSASRTNSSSDGSLPDNIVPVEYIESTGAQYIDTGITPDIDGITILDSFFTVAGTVPWGCVNFTEVSGYWRYFRSNGAGGYYVYSRAERRLLEIDGISKQIFYNGRGLSVANFFQSPASGSLWLFGRSDTGALGKLAIYRFFASDGYGNPMSDMIPVRFFDGESWVGAMYDFVSESVFLNQGTGSFLLGPDL